MLKPKIMKLIKLYGAIAIALLITSCDLVDPVYHSYVDLGLSVNWATCNIGADKPEETGDYFAWGEVYSGQGVENSYMWYEHPDSEVVSVGKYCVNSNNGKIDNKSTLESYDDAARRRWGNEWRMPTLSEVEELINKCRWIHTTYNGVEGFKVIGPSGESIFLPVSGYKLEGKRYNKNNVYFWTSSLYKKNCFNAYTLEVSSNFITPIVLQRHIAQTIRPVRP